MAYLPQYYGTDPIEEPIHEFIRAFEIYCRVKNIGIEERYGLLDSLIAEPAKTEYDAALAPGVPNGIVSPNIPDEAAQGAAPAAVAAALDAIE